MKTRWAKMTVAAALMFLVPALAGCGALGGSDAVATIEVDLTMYAAESDTLRSAVTAERQMAAATLEAAGTEVAAHSAINAALASTLRANYTPTPAVRPVVVSAEDMGSSLDGDMMDDAAALMRISNFAAAAGVDANTGCATGQAQQFPANAERIYVTAHVTSLISDSAFDVDWTYEDRVVYRVSWRADYSKDFECIWFYATPADFSFLPGRYTATLFVNGSAQGSATFTIAPA